MSGSGTTECQILLPQANLLLLPLRCFALPAHKRAGWESCKQVNGEMHSHMFTAKQPPACHAKLGKCKKPRAGRLGAEMHSHMFTAKQPPACRAPRATLRA